MEGTTSLRRPSFEVTDTRETLVLVDWHGVRRQTFFQEGASLPRPGEPGAVFARYDNDDIAAAS